MNAVISGRNGVAVVMDGERCFLVRAYAPEAWLPLPRDLAPRALGEAADLEFVNGDDRTVIQAHLDRAADRMEALQLFLALFDDELSQGARHEGAVELEELLAEADVLAFVRNVVFAQPLPPVADASGASSVVEGEALGRCKDLLADVVSHQELIATVRDAWDRVTLLTERPAAANTIAVRSGVFPLLVRALSTGHEVDLEHPLLRGLDLCDTVLTSLQRLPEVLRPQLQQPAESGSQGHRRPREKRGKAHQGNSAAGGSIVFGEYALVALDRSWLTSRQIESARIAMTRHVKRGGKIWIRVFPDKSYARKPAETRMDSVKGAPKGWVAAVKPGRVLFEMSGVAEPLAREAMRRAAYKLTIPVKFIIKGQLEAEDMPEPVARGDTAPRTKKTRKTAKSMKPVKVAK